MCTVYDNVLPWLHVLKSICIEFGPGSYVVNYGFIIMPFVVDKYAWDFYMENANLELISSIYSI